MLRDIKFKPIYRRFKDDFEREFMIPSYSESVNFDRASGYFSLNSLILCFDGILSFLKNKGIIRLVCNPQLSDLDIELIAKGESLSQKQIGDIISKEINKEEDYSPEILSKMDIICNMIAEKKLEIKIAFMEKNGIFHEKFGLFTDASNNTVHYLGSNNETRGGLQINMESFSVDESWEGKKDIERIKDQQEHFDRMWNNTEKGLIIIPFSKALQDNLFARFKKNDSLSEAILKYKSLSNKKEKKELYPYQQKAISEFLGNDCHHFYEMATGTGKTFTAVKTIRSLAKNTANNFYTIICVPQIDLQVQWEQALLEEGFEKIFLFGGNGTGFDNMLTKSIIDFKLGKKDIICVAVYDTFFTKVWEQIKNISPVFLIVDEAHNLTPGHLSKLKTINPRYRLGLSATIQRFSEEESGAITKFFTPGDTFYYGIEEAIGNGFLSKYEYYPIIVRLIEDENDKFIRKSVLFAQELNKKEPDTETIDRLRRERSLIIKQASNKIVKIRELMDEGYPFVNSVVYCGQGKDAEGESIIDSVTKTISDKGLVVSQFTSHTLDRKRVLLEFESGYFDTLVAIRCFDEGVDVPKLDKIYIMASDSALRQTVQRRGRVLRKCKESGKTIAFIYDFLVLPPISAGTFGADSLIKTELLRAREYNRLANNKDKNEEMFLNIEETYHITYDDIIENETESY